MSFVAKGTKFASFDLVLLKKNLESEELALLLCPLQLLMGSMARRS
jgi:hypothetical protein